MCVTLRETVKSAIESNWGLGSTPVFIEIFEIKHLESERAANPELVWVYQYKLSPVTHITPNRYNPHYYFEVGVQSKTDGDTAEAYRDEVRRILLSQGNVAGVDVIRCQQQEDISNPRMGVYAHRLLFDMIIIAEVAV